MSQLHGLRTLLLGVFVLVLSACTTQMTKPQQGSVEYVAAKRLIAVGQVDEGLAKLRQLVTEQPDNLEIRNYLKHQQDIQLAYLLRAADSHRQQSHWEDAAVLYQQALQMASDSQLAMDGLRLLEVGKKHTQMLVTAQALMNKNELDSAQNIARSILAEDATHQPARALFEQIEQKRIDKVTATPKIKTAFKKPITLEFKDIPLKSVFEFISRAGNINFSYDPDLRQDTRVSIFVRNTSIEDAIQVILTTYHLEKKILNDNTVLIFPSSHSQDYQELYVRSFYLGNMDAKRAMNLIKTVVKTKDLYIDEKLNTLVMRDTAEAVKLAEKLISSQDLPDPEVMLEVEVMEVSRKSLEDIGIQYPTQASLGVRGSSTSNGTTTLNSGQLSLAELKDFSAGMGVFRITDPVLALNLLNQDTDTNLLANPHIRVKNREKAKIHIGDKIPVITSTASSTGFVAQSVTYLEVGVKLNVEPTILLNDDVSIKVGLEVSNQTDPVTSSSGTLTYTIGTRNADTILRLKNGETQVLAGLFRDDSQNITNKFPGLSNLPLIGRLFSDANKNHLKKEIILLITPRVLSNITPPNAIYTAFPSGVESGKSGGNKTNQPDYSPPAVSIQPVKTPQEIQSAQAQSDKDFADSVMKPVADPNVKP